MAKMTASITVALPANGMVYAPLELPNHTVAYAVISADFTRSAKNEQAAGVSVAPAAVAFLDEKEQQAPSNKKRFKLLVAMKLPSEPTYFTAWHRAVAAYPKLPWVQVSRVKVGRSSSGSPSGFDVIPFSFCPETGQIELDLPQDSPLISNYRRFFDQSDPPATFGGGYDNLDDHVDEEV